MSEPEYDIQGFVRQKYGERASPYIAARIKAGYLPPEDEYETLLDRLVNVECEWLDVGCGRAPCPNNLALSARLANRCRRLVGVDPDGSIYDNPYLHERCQAPLEQYVPERLFSLVTARMVVEHVDRPKDFVASLARVAAPNAQVVIFTVNLRSVTAIAARCSPMPVHHLLKKRLWGTSAEDTFSTRYKMNRRKTLIRLMSEGGFREAGFQVVPDASLFWRLPSLRRMELKCFQAMRRLRLPYFDSCILAVYRRLADDAGSQILTQ